MIAKDDDDIFLISVILFYFFEKFINIPIKLYDGIADIKEFFIFFGTKAIRRMGVDCFDKEDEGNPFLLESKIFLYSPIEKKGIPVPPLGPLMSL